jgi:streptomycin 6-kinase
VADSTLVAIAEWREGAERLAAEIARDLELELGDPYAPGFCGHVVRATMRDGTPAVLKVFFPDHESLQEADALERWDGDGAIRLLDRDDERCALLLERCEPGEFLSSAGGERALAVLVGLLPRLWKSAHGFHTLTDEVERWIERDLDAGIAGLARDLASSQGELVLVHQDLHGDNVVSAQREPWLVIDPKPLAAEREFAVAPIIRSGELGHSKRDVVYRLDRLCDELELDRERARWWTVVQTLAWSEGNRIESHLEVVEWLR